MKKIIIFFIFLMFLLLLTAMPNLFSQNDHSTIRIPPPSDLPEPGL